MYDAWIPTMHACMHEKIVGRIIFEGQGPAEVVEARSKVPSFRYLIIIVQKSKKPR